MGLINNIYLKVYCVKLTNKIHILFLMCSNHFHYSIFVVVYCFLYFVKRSWNHIIFWTSQAMKDEFDPSCCSLVDFFEIIYWEVILVAFRCHQLWNFGLTSTIVIILPSFQNDDRTARTLYGRCTVVFAIFNKNFARTHPYMYGRCRPSWAWFATIFKLSPNFA